jgi:hypothetical protein
VALDAVDEPLVRIRDRGRVRQQHMVAHGLETSARVLRRDVLGVMEVERRAVVDQPEPVVPPEQVRVLRRPVDVRREGVEPDDVRGELRRRRRPGGRG